MNGEDAFICETYHRPMTLGAKTTSGGPDAGPRALCAVLAVAGLALAATPAAAKERATVSANARAVILENLSFVKVDDLDFGKLIAGTSAGTVVVSPASVRTATGGVRLAASTSVKAAKFAGKGSVNQLLTIMVTSNSVTLTRSGGGDTMTMDTFVIGSNPTVQLSTTPQLFFIGTASGMFQVPIGATLRVKAAQTPGIYAGAFTVTVQYQ